MSSDEIIEKLDQQLEPLAKRDKKKFSDVELSDIVLKIYGILKSEISSLKNEVRILDAHVVRIYDELRLKENGKEMITTISKVLDFLKYGELISVDYVAVP